MSTESRSKKLYYKRADVVGGHRRPLSEMLGDALSRETHPLRRGEHIGEHGETVRVMDKPRTLGRLVCTSLIEFTEGVHQDCVRVNPDDLELAIRQLPPGDQEQFIAHTAFIGIQDHHVILLQAAGLRSAEVEQHLNWLLGKQTRVLPDGASISLRDEPSRDARRKLKNVKSLTLRAPIPVGIFQGEAEDLPKTHSIIGAAAAKIFSSAREHGFFVEELRGADALALEDIEVLLQIKRRGKQKPNTSIIDDLAYALRNTDDEVFELLTRSGKVLKSGDLKLSQPKSVKLLNGRPQLASVAEKMHEWLAELLQDKQVSEI